MYELYEVASRSVQRNGMVFTSSSGTGWSRYIVMFLMHCLFLQVRVAVCGA